MTKKPTRGGRTKMTAADKAGTDAAIRERVESLGTPTLPEATSAAPVGESKADNVEVASALVTPHQAMLNVLLLGAEPLTANRVNVIRNAIRDLCVVALVADPKQLHEIARTLAAGAKNVNGAATAIVPPNVK